MNKQMDTYSAILVNDGFIKATGSRDELKAKYNFSKEIDLQGYTILPAFTDSHLHLLNFGLGLDNIILDNCTLDESLAKVHETTKMVPSNEWIIGRGFNFNDWEEGWPQMSWLDKVAPNHPVVLIAKDGHLVWGNRIAFELANITKETLAPEGGAITKDANGELVGTLTEKAITLLLNKIPSPSEVARKRALEKAISVAYSFGITAVHTMEDRQTWLALQELRESKGLKFRVLLSIPVEELDSAINLGIRTGFGDQILRIGSVKIFADGSLGSRTAWMLKPYTGTNNFGIRVTNENRLKEMIAKANNAGLSVAVHAIGDGANRAVLDAIETVGNRKLRNRIEHAQLVSPVDIPRFAQLNIVASMQPTQCPEDRYMSDEHWGERCAFAYPFRSLLDSGATLAFGSDAPVESCDTLLGLYSAVARKRWNEAGSESWYFNQAISIEEAVKGYTIGAAIAANEEHYRGKLETGYQADFTILSHDIFNNEPEILKETKIVATYFQGKKVFSK
ncbi:MAG: amidohydrolase [Firmicutes bacterium]|nr:amidohydrolase [Bacillota bacterium]